MNKTNKILTFSIYLIYYIICTFVIVYMYLLYNTGHLSLFEDSYNIFPIMIPLISVLIYFIPLIFSKLKVNKFFIPFASFFGVLIYVIVFMMLYNVTIFQYKEFTQEKWIKFPEQRYLMLDNLKNDFNIIDMHIDEVRKLLGNPSHSVDKYWIYCCKYRSIELYFDSHYNLESINVRSY